MASSCDDDDYGGFNLSKELPLSWPLKGKRNRASSHDGDSASNNNVRLESEDYTRLLLMAEVCATVASGTPLLPKDDPCLAHAEFVGQIGSKRRRLDDNYVRTLPAAPANRDGENRKIGCQHCEKEFWSYQALGGHRTIHKQAKNSSPDRNNGECNRNEQPKVYSCKDCDRKFASSQALGGHRSTPLCKRNNNNNNNSNSLDVIVVKNNNDVVEAREQDHEQKHKCNDCNREFISHHALGGHLSSHLKHKKNVVNVNQDRTNSADTSTSSAKNKNEQQTVPIHQCRHCQLIFPTGRALGGHQRLHYKPPVETKEQNSSALDGLLVMISICRLRRRMEYTRRN